MRIFLYKKSDVLRCSSKPLFPFGGFTYPFLRRNDTSLSLYCTAHTGNSVRDKAVRASAVLWGSLPCIPSIKHLAFIDHPSKCPGARVFGCLRRANSLSVRGGKQGQNLRSPSPIRADLFIHFPFLHPIIRVALAEWSNGSSRLSLGRDQGSIPCFAIIIILNSFTIDFTQEGTAVRAVLFWWGR